ncbi:hypothetical protein [Paraburkholderia sp. 2C]
MVAGVKPSAPKEASSSSSTNTSEILIGLSSDEIEITRIFRQQRYLIAVRDFDESPHPCHSRQRLIQSRRSPTFLHSLDLLAPFDTRLAGFVCHALSTTGENAQHTPANLSGIKLELMQSTTLNPAFFIFHNIPFLPF